MKLPGLPVALVLLVLFSAEASRRKDRAMHYMQYEGPDVGNVSATLERKEQSLMNAGSNMASETEDSSSDENSDSKAEEGSGSQGARTIDMWACGKIRVSGAGFKKCNGDYPIKGFSQGFTMFCKNNNCRDSRIFWNAGWGWGIQTNTHGMHHRYNMRPRGKKTTIMNALPSGWQLRDRCTYSSRSRHCGKNPLPKFTCLAKVKTATCPGGTDTIRYRGSAKGADIGGCGLTSCANRYRADRNTPEKCRDGCAKHGGCRSFSFAYPGADPTFGQKTVCTYYPKTRANQKYGEHQVLCKVKAVLKFKVKTMIQAMQRMVGATMLPKILAEHRAAQRLADRVYRGFATCSRIQKAAGRGLAAMLRSRRSIGVSFKRCKKTQAARAVRAKTCTQVLVADNRAKAAACSAFRVVQKEPRKEWVVCKSNGRRGSYGAWVAQMKRVFAKKDIQYKRYKVACDKASRKASARARRCAPFSRSVIRTKATCDARQDQLELTTCNILTRTRSGCQKYMPCFERAKATSVRELRDIKRLANIRRAQFAEALRLRCLLGHGCKANAKQIKECAKRAQKETVSRLKLRYRRIPSIPRRCPAPVQPTCSSRYISSFYSGLPRMAQAKRCKACVGLSSALSLPSHFKVRCEHDPAWSYVLDYSDVRSKDDLPSNRNLIARGFSNSNAFYIGNKRLQKLNIVKAEICALSSKTRTRAGSCQWSCKLLANSYWGNGRCSTCGGLNTNVKKIIAGLSGQMTSGNILINMNPEIARFQEKLKNIPWNCHRHRNLYAWGVGWHKAGWGISMRADHRAGNYEVGWYNNHCRYRGRLDVDTFQIRVQLKPQKITPKKFANVGNIPGCKGVKTFAGQGSCSRKYSFKQVADFWCKKAGYAAAVTWKEVKGSQKLCYINKNYGKWHKMSPTAVSVKYYTGYGCSSSCKCFKDLRCAGMIPKKRVDVGRIAGCGGAKTFAGQGSCSKAYNYKQVADFWCKRAGYAEAITWKSVKGSQNLCYINKNYGKWQTMSPTAVSVKQLGGYGCSGKCKCFKDLRCAGGKVKRRSISSIPACKGATTFGGQGSCSRKYNFQQVADFWCKRAGMSKAVSWSAVKGSQKLCYISGNYGQWQRMAPSSVRIKMLNGYGCSGHCKCFKNLKCS